MQLITLYPTYIYNLSQNICMHFHIMCLRFFLFSFNPLKLQTQNTFIWATLDFLFPKLVWYVKDLLSSTRSHRLQNDPCQIISATMQQFVLWDMEMSEGHIAVISESDPESIPPKTF